MAWWVSENAPVMTAWDAMMVASVARITIGSRAQAGNSRKNGFSSLAGSDRISAPWPR